MGYFSNLLPLPNLLILLSTLRSYIACFFSIMFSICWVFKGLISNSRWWRYDFNLCSISFALLMLEKCHPPLLMNLMLIYFVFEKIVSILKKGYFWGRAGCFQEYKTYSDQNTHTKDVHVGPRITFSKLYVVLFKRISRCWVDSICYTYKLY